MKRRPPIALALAALVLLFPLATSVHAGWGDAIKAKAQKALKGEKPKPAAETGPITSRMAPEVTAERLARFQKGMEVEIAEMEKAKKILASLPDKATRDKCAQQVAMSAEAQRLTQKWAETVSSAKPEDQQALTLSLSVTMDSLVTSKCGPDPSMYDAHRMSREALAKGSDTAALGDDMAYRAWKEWVLEFCNYIEKVMKQPDGKDQIAKMKTDGLRIPGSGTGVFFVYTASEATLLLDLCPKLKPLIEATY